MWIFQPNSHVKIWTNGPLPGSGVPGGAPAYDGPGQLLIPLLSGAVSSPWRGRLAVPSAGLSITSALINSLTTSCWLQVLDDVSTITYSWYIVSDLSVSSAPVIAAPTTFQVAYLFLTYYLAPG